MATREEIKDLLKDALEPINDRLVRINDRLGALVESDVRKTAASMFGDSFAKPFLIRSVHDAVYLVSKAKFEVLRPDAYVERQKAAEKLAKKAADYVAPLVRAFLASFEKDYGKVAEAKEAVNNKDYSKCLGMLIREANKEGSKVTYNVKEKLERLKKACPKPQKNDGAEEAGDLSNLLSCEGPGVMLLQVASIFTKVQLMTEDNIFDKGVLYEEIELDMRGTISLVGRHATIACGETKSSLALRAKGVSQLQVRTRFLETVVQVLFPDKFEHFVLIGHLFFPRDAKNARQQLRPNDGPPNTPVSIYHHFV